MSADPLFRYVLGIGPAGLVQENSVRHHHFASFVLPKPIFEYVHTSKSAQSFIINAIFVLSYHIIGTMMMGSRLTIKRYAITASTNFPS